MDQQFEQTPGANLFQMISSPDRVQGTVQRVDVVGRVITVLLPTGPAHFDVPGNCAIDLRGERVKFRMIQPGDQARITFTRHAGMLVAQALEVQPNTER